MFFLFNATATTEIYTLSLHDALPISVAVSDNSRYRIPRLVQIRCWIGKPAETSVGISNHGGKRLVDLMSDRRGKRSEERRVGKECGWGWWREPWRDEHKWDLIAMQYA